MLDGWHGRNLEDFEIRASHDCGAREADVVWSGWTNVVDSCSWMDGWRAERQQTPRRRLKIVMEFQGFVTCKMPEKCGMNATPPRYNSLLAITLEHQNCGFILSPVVLSRSRSPSAAPNVFDSVPHCQLPPFFPCRNHADRKGCEPDDRSIRTRTAQEAEASLVQKQEKRTSREQVVAARSTCCLSTSSRPTAEPTSTASPNPQSRSLCSFQRRFS